MTDVQPETENTRLRHQAINLAYIEGQIDEAEAKLAELKAKRLVLCRETLPQLFAEAGIRSLTLSDGSKILLSMMAEGSLPKTPEERTAALDWLVANGYGELVENKVVASWTRGDRDKALAEYQRLAALGTAKVQLDETIHPRTLAARMKDRVVGGLETPLTLLGVAVFAACRFTKRAES